MLVVKDSHWPVVFQHHLLSLAAIPLISALELALGRDADLNQELRAGGVSNLPAALVGSPSDFVAVAETMLGQRLGADSRLLGYVIAAFTLLTLLFGASIVAYIPRVVAGGVLSFMGLAFLVEWLYDSWFRVSRADYVMIWVIMLAIGLVGFLEGVAAELHGNLFFGTARRLFSHLRTSLEARGLEQIQFVVLDFRLVTGMDSSVTTSFQRLVRHLTQADVQLVV